MLKKSRLKNEITRWEISSFYDYVPKIMITQYMVPETWGATDVRTDRKFDIYIYRERWVPHMKALLFFPNYSQPRKNPVKSVHFGSYRILIQILSQIYLTVSISWSFFHVLGFTP